MGQLIGSIAGIVVMLGIVILAFTLCRIYVFSKVRINKYIPLVIALVLLAIQIILGKRINPYLNYGISFFAVLFFLWFMEIIQTGGPKKKEKQIKIKPKAKPNRVKNKKQDN